MTCELEISVERAFSRGRGEAFAESAGNYARTPSEPDVFKVKKAETA